MKDTIFGLAAKGDLYCRCSQNSYSKAVGSLPMNITIGALKKKKKREEKKNSNSSPIFIFANCTCSRGIALFIMFCSASIKDYVIRHGLQSRVGK